MAKSEKSIPPSLNFFLTVAQNFDDYKKGDQIHDEGKIADILKKHANFVIKTALRGN